MSIFYDTETCGLHGVPVLIQWAKDDGPVTLHSVWTEPSRDTLRLIEQMMLEGVVGFNMAFDHFHLSKIYNMLRLWNQPNGIPADHVDEIALLEPAARDGKCLKPVHCCDLMLVARKGKYQSTMDRDDIRIKRVPTALAYELCDKLTELVKLPGIYFARSANKRQWHVVDREEDDDFKDVILKFNPSSALKALAIDTGIAESVTKYSEIELESHYRPIEYGYAPFAMAGLWNKKRKKVIPVGPGKWFGTWPGVLHHHIAHWAYNRLAREYAEADVILTRRLYKHFGCPAMDDDDSVLACAVASNRWKGFTIDAEMLKGKRAEAYDVATRYDFINAPAKVKVFLGQVMDDTEKIILDNTAKATLVEIAEWKSDDGKVHPAAERAKLILQSRSAMKEVELYDKLLMAGRFHASFKVIGTLSSRMSGADGLNPQGIKRTEDVRRCFKFASPGTILSGGDFDSFEVTLADAEYNDPRLRELLLSGKKIQAVFGEYLFADRDYESILESKGTDDDYYTPAKSGFLAMMYGGEAHTLETRLSIAPEQADEAYRKFLLDFPEIMRARQRVFDMFCLPSSTWIHTAEGPQQIKSLLDKPIMIISNGSKYTSQGFYPVGSKQIFEIITQNGYRIQATENHPFSVNFLQNLRRGDEGIDTWLPVKDLKIGMSLRLQNHNDFVWDSYGSFEDGYVLGWLFGDGSIAKNARDNRLYFYCDDFFALPYFERLLNTERRHIPQSNCYYIKCEKLDTLIADYGISYDKTISPTLEMASANFYRGFISALYDTDGSVSLKTKQISLSQSNLYRLEATQRMLLRLGIQSSIRPAIKAGQTIIEGRKCKCQDSFTLNIYKANTIRFEKEIGLRNPEKAKRLSNVIEACDKRKCYSNYFLTKIKSIEPKGVQEVYDIHVPIAEQFDANGFVVHNCSMRQPKGLGTKVEWHEPADHIESMLGFRRYFTLENKICRALFALAENPPDTWRKMKIKVVRRDREQTVSGAVQSALFGAAFGIQSACMRAACNHRIQSTGAQITKHLQRRIWNLQPYGISEWVVQVYNGHDEIMATHHPDLAEMIAQTVKATITGFQTKIPLLKMEWKSNLSTWAEK